MAVYVLTACSWTPYVNSHTYWNTAEDELNELAAYYGAASVTMVCSGHHCRTFIRCARCGLENSTRVLHIPCVGAGC